MENDFINFKKNDIFSSLRGIDLQDLLVETENYLLEYRNKLKLPKYVTFGIELEYEGISKKNIDKFLMNDFDGWCSKEDASLTYGGEIISPILYDKNKYWIQLKKVCDYLNSKKVNTSNNAGGHIHVGACVLGKDISAWRQFLKLYAIYESVIFRFCYGDKISARKKILKYASPVADIIYEMMPMINKATTLEELRYLLPTSEKYLALCFCHVNFDNIEKNIWKNTLEFRSPNATSNAVIWQNNINAFAKMLVSSKEKVMNEEFLDYKLEHEFLSYSENKYLYNEINLKNVLEFVDLIFYNNLDKIYFLRQYLKNFQNNYGINTAVKAKKFVK